jgi:hypothetical protein
LPDSVEVQVLATDHQDRNSADFQRHSPFDVIAGPGKLDRDRQVISYLMPTALTQTDGGKSFEIARRGLRAEV